MNYPTALRGPSFNFQIARGSSKLVLFFSGIGARDGSFQYWRVGRSLGTHCLFLNDGRKHWYQSGVAGLGDSIEATVATIQSWARELGADEIYAFGQSMGAHGAVLYGSRLGARVLAFCAETILGLEASRSSRMLNGDAEIKYPDLQHVMARAEMPIFTFAGERDPVDLYCMSKAQGLPNFHPRTILHLGHDVAAPLHKEKRLIPLVKMFVANQEIPAMADEGSALTHPGFAEAFYDLYRHSRAGRNQQAAVAGKLSISFYRNSDDAFFLTAKALFALKQPAKALGLLENALAIAPRNVEYRFLIGQMPGEAWRSGACPGHAPGDSRRAPGLREFLPPYRAYPLHPRRLSQGAGSLPARRRAQARQSGLCQPSLQDRTEAWRFSAAGPGRCDQSLSIVRRRGRATPIASV